MKLPILFIALLSLLPICSRTLHAEDKDSWKEPFGPFDYTRTVIINYQIPKEAAASTVAGIFFVLVPTDGKRREIPVYSTAVRGHLPEEATSQSLVIRVPAKWVLEFKRVIGNPQRIVRWSLEEP